VESNQEVVREEIMTEDELLLRGIEPQFTREGVFFRRRVGRFGWSVLGKTVRFVEHGAGMIKRLPGGDLAAALAASCGPASAGEQQSGGASSSLRPAAMASRAREDVELGSGRCAMGFPRGAAELNAEESSGGGRGVRTGGGAPTGEIRSPAGGRNAVAAVWPAGARGDMWKKAYDSWAGCDFGHFSRLEKPTSSMMKI
jgi:hypothetical protein